jgi:phosphotransferase system HPr-like phosphotransfer protein
MTSWLQGEVLVTHDAGLHARPSVQLTKLAEALPVPLKSRALRKVLGRCQYRQGDGIEG